MEPHADITGRKRTWVVVLTGIASMMAALDTVVVSTALSTVRVHLHASVGQLEWTVNAYNLSFAVLLMTTAALGDRFGRKRMFALGLALFSAASAACAVSPDVGFLIAARAVQGAGAAFILPLALALLTAAFPPEKRGTAIGMFSAVTGISVALGPIVGGAIVQGIDWSWIFWVNVPIGLLAIPLVLRRLDESFGKRVGARHPGRGADHRPPRSAWSGDSYEATRPVGAAPRSVGSLIAGALFAVAFVALGAAGARADAADELLPLADVHRRQRGDLLRARVAVRRRVLLPAAAADRPSLRRAPDRPAADGLDDARSSSSPRSWARWSIGSESGPLMVSGLLIQCGGTAWIASIARPGLPFSHLVVPLIVAGVGISMAIPSAQNSVVGSATLETAGKLAGINSMMRELGGVFGIAVAVAVFAGFGGYASAQAFTNGFGPAIWVSSGLALLGALCGLALPARRRREVIAAIPSLPAPAIELEQAA